MCVRYKSVGFIHLLAKPFDNAALRLALSTARNKQVRGPMAAPTMGTPLDLVPEGSHTLDVLE
jgi:hypothetical protein